MTRPTIESKDPFRLGPEAAAPGQHGAVAQDDLGVAVEPGLDLADGFQADDLGTVEAQEASGVEAALEIAEGAAAAVFRAVGEDAQVVGLGADEVDLVDGEERLAPLAALHQQLPRVLGGGPHGGEQMLDTPRQVARSGEL